MPGSMQFNITDGVTTITINATKDANHYVWQSSSTQADSIEAEDVTGAAGNPVADFLAGNDVVQVLDGISEEIAWDTGVLDSGDYIAYVYWRHFDQGATAGMTFDVVTDEITPVTLATTTVVGPGPTDYEVPEQLAFTITNPIGVTIRVTLLTNNDEWRIDRFRYDYQNPMMLSGNNVRVYAITDGNVEYSGDKANWTVWY